MILILLLRFFAHVLFGLFFVFDWDTLKKPKTPNPKTIHSTPPHQTPPTTTKNLQQTNTHLIPKQQKTHRPTYTPNKTQNKNPTTHHNKKKPTNPHHPKNHLPHQKPTNTNPPKTPKTKNSCSHNNTQQATFPFHISFSVKLHFLFVWWRAYRCTKFRCLNVSESVELSCLVNGTVPCLPLLREVFLYSDIGLLRFFVEDLLFSYAFQRSFKSGIQLCYQLFCLGAACPPVLCFIAVTFPWRDLPVENREYFACI